MAPARSKKAKVSAENESQSRDQKMATPDRAPLRGVRITEAQKQAMIDNLQLEVTERARKLRAQYALQAQSLRTRLELRINRIPTSLRKANMGDLYAKYEEVQINKESGEQKVLDSERHTTDSKALAKAKGRKRKSEEMEESEGSSIRIHEDPIPDQLKAKKRTKPAEKSSTSRAPNPGAVLSPKSGNSRTVTDSAKRKALTQQKSFESRPISPLKSTSPSKHHAATTLLASMVGDKSKGSVRSKGAGLGAYKSAAAAYHSDEPRTISSASNSSAASTGTTIIRQQQQQKMQAAAKRATGATARRSKASAGESPVKKGRLLRKRA